MKQTNVNTQCQREIRLSKVFDTASSYPATLVFVAGPNANADINRNRATSTVRRTLNAKAVNDYYLFREAVKNALCAGLDAMVLDKVDVALVARVSCGIYAGKHKHNINNDFQLLVDELLAEPIGPNGEARGRYFDRVIIPMIS